MEYNISTPDFSTKYVMENSAHAISARLDKNLMYGVECAKGANIQNCYYVRNGASSLPITTTDLGKFQLALAPSATVPVSTVVGELWVSYDVCLKRPIMDFPTGVAHISSTAVTAGNMFGTGTVQNYGYSNWARPNSGTLTFTNSVPGDIFLISYHITGTVAAAIVYPTITLTNLQAYNALANYTTHVDTAPSATTLNLDMAQQIVVQSTASSGRVVLTGATIPTGTVVGDWFITFIGNNIASGTL